jgi:transcriptional regulator with XRE-family HTH domain
MSEQTAAPHGVPDWDTADRLRKALRHAGIGVQEIADYLDVSRTSVSNWINGRVDPSTQTLRLWALRCGVSYPWLADGEESRARESNPPELFPQVRAARRARRSPPCCEPRHLTLVVA